jgi:hypothetical protein
MRHTILCIVQRSLEGLLQVSRRCSHFARASTTSKVVVAGRTYGAPAEMSAKRVALSASKVSNRSTQRSLDSNFARFVDSSIFSRQFVIRTYVRFSRCSFTCPPVTSALGFPPPILRHAGSSRAHLPAQALLPRSEALQLHAQQHLSAPSYRSHQSVPA